MSDRAKAALQAAAQRKAAVLAQESQKEDQIEKVDSKTPQTQVDSLSPSASLEYRGQDSLETIPATPSSFEKALEEARLVLDKESEEKSRLPLATPVRSDVAPQRVEEYYSPDTNVSGDWKSHSWYHQWDSQWDYYKWGWPSWERI